MNQQEIDNFITIHDLDDNYATEKIYMNYMDLGGTKEYELFKDLLKSFYYWTYDLYINGIYTQKVTSKNETVEIDSCRHSISMFTDDVLKGDHYEKDLIFKAVDSFSAYT